MANELIKQKLHRIIDTIEDESTLLQLKQIIDSIVNNSKYEYSTVSNELRASIVKGIKELDDGKKIPYEEVRKSVQKDLKNK